MEYKNTPTPNLNTGLCHILKRFLMIFPNSFNKWHWVNLPEMQHQLTQSSVSNVSSKIGGSTDTAVNVGVILKSFLVEIRPYSLQYFTDIITELNNLDNVILST